MMNTVVSLVLMMSSRLLMDKKWFVLSFVLSLFVRNVEFVVAIHYFHDHVFVLVSRGKGEGSPVVVIGLGAS